MDVASLLLLKGGRGREKVRRRRNSRRGRKRGQKEGKEEPRRKRGCNREARGPSGRLLTSSSLLLPFPWSSRVPDALKREFNRNLKL